MAIDIDQKDFKRTKPGRPKGSKTSADTVGKKRARRFFELVLDEAMLPTMAARSVSDEFGTGVSEVFKAKKRHEQSLANECLIQARETKLTIENNLLIADMGPHELEGKALIFHLAREALKGNTK